MKTSLVLDDAACEIQTYLTGVSRQVLEWGGLSCGEEALLPAPADRPDRQNTTCGARGAFGAFIFVFFVLYERRMGSNPWSCPCSSSLPNMVGTET